jgi:CBS-domain-containing membrane protein
MIPLDDCAVVSKDTNLRDAVIALNEAQDRIPKDRQPHRAILVADDSGQIIGKVGQLAFLKAIDIGVSITSDIDTLTRAGVSDELISTLMEHLRSMEDILDDVRSHACGVRVKDAMHPITESIDENASLLEAVHRIVEWKQLSLVVTRGDKVVGLLRLSDLFETVAKQILEIEECG